MEKKLEFIFENVNNWLKFAEAKNAMILGFNGVLFFGVLKAYHSFEVEKTITFLECYLMVAGLFLIFSSLNALLSFVPNFKILRPSFDFHQKSENYLYFDVLRCKSIKEITSKYMTKDEVVTDYHNHLAEQIITNATITKRKYDYFTFSIWLSVSALVTPVIAALFFLFNYLKN